MSEITENTSTTCHICQSAEHQAFITTSAMMHTGEEARQFHFRKCQRCESVFLADPVAEIELPKYYSKYYLPYQGSEAWGKYASFVNNSQRKLDAKRLSILKAAMKGSKEKFSLLDVGCGKPSFLQLVSKKLKADCSGIDFTDQGWKDGQYKGVQLEESSLADYTPEQSFDVITLWHYLEHDYHLRDTVEKLDQCLKPGGKLIIEVPDYQSLTARRQGKFWQGWHSPRHLSLFSTKGFEELFPKPKWTIKRHQRYGTLDAFTLWWLGKMEAKRIDWSKNMEKEFWPLVALKILSFPIFIFEKLIPMGIQLLVIEKNREA